MPNPIDVVEALLFASDAPLEPERIREVLDLESVDSMVDFYEAAGASGLTVLGQLGEAPKLTAEEARIVVRRVLRRLGGRLPVVVGVSAPGLAPMRELAEAVMGEGAAGVMVAPPWTIRTDDQAYGFYASVGEALSSDEHAVALEPRLKELERRAFELIQQAVARPPPSTLDAPPPARPGARIIQTGKETNLSRSSALAVLRGIERDLDDTKRLSVSWTITQEDATK